MGEPMQGRVAAILSTRDLVINRGAAHGVAVGQRFAVLDPAGTDIIEPETGVVLGSVRRSKVKVEAITVEPRLAVCRTYESYTTKSGGSGLDERVLGLFQPSRTEVHFKTLKANDALWEELNEAESYVKIGDPVVEVVDITSPQKTAG